MHISMPILALVLIGSLLRDSDGWGPSIPLRSRFPDACRAVRFVARNCTLQAQLLESSVAKHAQIGRQAVKTALDAPMTTPTKGQSAAAAVGGGPNASPARVRLAQQVPSPLTTDLEIVFLIDFLCGIDWDLPPQNRSVHQYRIRVSYYSCIYSVS